MERLVSSLHAFLLCNVLGRHRMLELWKYRRQNSAVSASETVLATNGLKQEQGQNVTFRERARVRTNAHIFSAITASKFKMQLNPPMDG
jgi:hypothetical protein